MKMNIYLKQVVESIIIVNDANFSEQVHKSLKNQIEN